jgi:hypothetical protein
MIIKGNYRATIHFTPVYRCGCGKEQPGYLATLDVEAQSSDQIAYALDNYQPRAHDMPIGWARHYGATEDYFTCPRCLPL